MHRVGGGYASGSRSPPARGSPPERKDLLSQLENELAVRDATIASLENQVKTLEMTAEQRRKQLEASSAARSSLQLEVAEAQRRGATFSNEIEALKQSYSQVEWTHSTEVNGLRSALDAMSQEMERQRVLAENTAAERDDREIQFAHAWEAEREALISAHAAEISTLQQGWASQRERLTQEAAAARQKADAVQEMADAAQKHQEDLV